MTEECVHGMTASWCGMCNPPKGSVAETRRGESGFHGGETKQDLLNALCLELGIPGEPIGVGSSIPSHVFDLMARRTGVSGESMPQIGEAVARKAGLVWGANCDSRGSVSGGGSTVTCDGLRVALIAVRLLTY